jgi:superfamily I DNA and/or RNA helicase
VDSLLALLRNHPFIGAINIGIVTPYRAQVNELNSLITKREWPKLFTEKIKVGTIHSFQGSETDLLIFDLVESKHTKLGRLYMHETGERLVNVAISRAKSKLIIVGDIKAINMNAGSNNVRQKVFKVFENLKRYKVNTA